MNNALLDISKAASQPIEEAAARLPGRRFVTGTGELLELNRDLIKNATGYEPGGIRCSFQR